MRKYLFFIVMLFVCSLLINTPATMAGTEAKFTDIDSHWAAMPINTMLNEGIINGYPDNTFRPDQVIKRAEFITLINKAYCFTATAEINYPDVNKTDWFWEEICKAKAASYLSGYVDGNIKPDNDVTRQEAAVIIARASKMGAGYKEELAHFKDAADIPEWSLGALAALTAKGYIGGYPDGSIRADRSISRAEAVLLISKVVADRQKLAISMEDGAELDKAGSYGPESGVKDIKGDVTIIAAGVILQNAKVDGNLLITEAVGDGDVTLKNVSVTGTTHINGGGASTITIDGCELGKTIINKKDGNIRVLLTGQSSIAELQVDSAANVAGQARIIKAIINADKVVIASKPDSFMIKSGLTATIEGKTEHGTPVSSGSDSSSESGSGYTMPEQVESLAVNQLLGMTFVTVKLKAESAADFDEVFILGQPALTQDGISYKKTFRGSIAHNRISVTLKSTNPEEQPTAGLIIPSGCSLEYISATDKSRILVQTSTTAITVSANDVPMQEESPCFWLCELEGEIISVTISASNGTNNEIYMLTDSE